ncbi:MAG TPA: hypothetical protein VNO21_18895 [Polyangiaceae bacterium]|nr:hypothetical protein [Polyangiaceae bacterium]
MRVGAPIWDLGSLLEVADVVVIASALEDRCSWEDGRIVTYSRVRIDRAIAGELGNDPHWIRTKGGTIGSICQFVDGEPVLQKTWPSLLFLVRVPAFPRPSIGPNDARRSSRITPDSNRPSGIPWGLGGFEVAGNAHGQFPIILGDRDEPRAIPSPWLCVLNPMAVELRLDPFANVTLDKLSRDLFKNWTRAHTARADS